MKIAICDDDPQVIAEITTIIREQFESLDLKLRSFTSGAELLAAVAKTDRPFDLIFLDIEMPGRNGLEVAEELQRATPKSRFVFATSHDEFALRGYELSAFRFLVKPLAADKVVAALQAVRDEQLQQAKLTVTFNGETSVILVSELLYIEAQGQNVQLVTAQRSYTQRNNLAYYQERLARSDFFQIHRSYLVNLAAVAAIDTGAYLQNGQRLPVSRLRRQQFKTALQDYLKRAAR